MAHPLCRYGWIPTASDFDASDSGRQLHAQYAWVDEASITHMEVVCGTLRQHANNANAVFMMRDVGVYADVPDDQRQRIVDSSASDQRMLAVSSMVFIWMHMCAGVEITTAQVLFETML